MRVKRFLVRLLPTTLADSLLDQNAPGQIAAHH
jgi:hypothetical protein